MGHGRCGVGKLQAAVLPAKSCTESATLFRAVKLRKEHQSRRAHEQTMAIVDRWLAPTFAVRTSVLVRSPRPDAQRSCQVRFTRSGRKTIRLPDYRRRRSIP